MKRKFLFLGCLLGSALLLASCGKDKVDETWKTLPQDEIAIENGNAHFMVNGIDSKKGTVKVVAKSATEADVTLTGIVPGYNTVLVNATLEKGENSTYTFAGKAALTENPAIFTLKSVAQNPIYVVTVEGDINVEGKVNAKVTTNLSENFRGTLANTWNINRIAPIVNGVPSTGVVWITWTFNDTKYAGATNLALVAGSMMGGLLSNYLDAVTFCPDGNITARYWEDEDNQEGGNILEKLVKYAPQEDEKGENMIYGNDHNDKWLESPAANFAFWYVRDGMLYVVPNAAAFADEGDDTNIDLGSLQTELQKLAAVGVDVTTLTAEVMKIMKNGVALKYTQEGDALKIYVDKAQCDPFVKSFIPALPLLDQMYEELKKSTDESDQQTVQMIQLVFAMVGIEKPSDFEGMWNATETFQIELNFKK